MSKTPKKRIALDKGVFSNASPHDAPLVECGNVGMVIAGQATVRRGMRPVTFSSAQGSSDSHQVLSVFAYRHALADWVIYLDSNGDLHAGRTPA